MANSAIVGMLRAVLVADTAQFDTALGKSSVKVGDFGKETTRAAQNLAKMLGGDALVKKANDIQQAMGLLATRGIKLTADEAAKLEPVVSKAILKLEAMGKAVDPSLRQTQQSLKDVADQGEKTGGAMGFLQGKAAALTAAFGAGIIFDRLITGLVSFGKEAIATAGKIVDLSQQTGLSIRAVQVYGEVAKETGGDLSTYADAIFKLGVNLARPTDEIKRLLADWHISLKSIQDMKPEDQFELVAEKLRGITHEGDRNRAGMDLMGKTWKGVTAGVVSGIDEIRDSMVIASDAEVLAIDRMSDAFDRMLANAKAKTISLIGQAAIWEQMLHDLGFPGAPNLGLNKPGAPKGPATTVPAPKDSGLDRVQKALDSLVDTLIGKDVADEMDRLVVAMDRASSRGGITALQIEKIDAKVRAWKESGEELNPVLAQFLDEQDEMNRALQTGTNRYAGIVAAIAPYARALVEKLAILDDINRVEREIQELERKSYLIDPTKSFGSRPGIYTAPPTAVLTAQEKYNGLLSLANDVMGELGQNGSKAWKLVNQGVMIAMKGMGEYIKALDAVGKAAQDAAKKAAIASAAQAGMWAAVVYAITGAINAYKEGVANSKEYLRLQQEIIALGAVPLPFDQSESGQGGGQMRRELNKLEEQLKALEKNSQQVTNRIGDMADSLVRFAGIAPNALKPFIADLLKSTRLTNEQRLALDAMLGKPKWQDIQQQAEALGVEIDALGSGFQQSKLNDLADGYLAFFTTATEMGGDPIKILAGMSDEVQALVDNAAKFGLKLPEFMKPMLDQMIKSGQLLDPKKVRSYIDTLMRAGNLTEEQRKALQGLGPDATWGDLQAVAKQMGITLDTSELTLALKDLTNFSFDDIKSSQDKMVDYLKEIRDILAYGTTPPVNNAVPRPTEPPRMPVATGGDIGPMRRFRELPPIIYPDWTKPGVRMPGFAAGTGGQLMNFGSGTPVMLHGWEGVYTAGQQMTGGGGGDTYNLNAMDSRSFETWLRSGANRAVMRTLPEAVRNASLARGR